MNDWTYYYNIQRDQENARNAELRAREAETEDRLRRGREAVNSQFDSVFTKDFYKGYADDIMAHWRPEADRQYSDAQRSLNYTFANQQPGGGSVSNEAFGRLKEAYDKSLLSLSDQATGQAVDFRKSNEAQRTGLLQQLNSGADPSMVVDSTQQTISNIPRTAQYSPLADMFSGIAGQFKVAQDNYYAGNPGWGFGVRGNSPFRTGSNEIVN